MNCRNCQSVNVNYHKAMYRNQAFHIYLTCEDCFVRYNVERNKHAYEKTKDKKWLTGEEITNQRREYSKKRKLLKKEKKRINKNQISLL